MNQYLVIADEDFCRPLSLSRVTDLVCESEADARATDFIQQRDSNKCYVFQLVREYHPKEFKRSPEIVYVERNK